MDGLEDMMTTLSFLTNTKKKRHLVGGILLSVSLLFGGLALTVMSIKNEENVYEQELD